MTDYPQHEILLNHEDEKDTISAFYDWLCGQDLVISEWRIVPFSFGEHELMPARQSPADLIAGFLGIDREAFDAEKDLMLERIRASAREVLDG